MSSRSWTEGCGGTDGSILWLYHSFRTPRHHSSLKMTLPDHMISGSFISISEAVSSEGKDATEFALTPSPDSLLSLGGHWLLRHWEDSTQTYCEVNWQTPLTATMSIFASTMQLARTGSDSGNPSASLTHEVESLEGGWRWTQKIASPELPANYDFRLSYSLAAKSEPEEVVRLKQTLWDHGVLIRSTNPSGI